MAQAQLHQVIRQFPGAIDLAVLAVDQVQLGSEILLRIKRHTEGHSQGAGALQLHFGNVHHLKRSASVALAQGSQILHGRRLLAGGGRRGGLFRGGGITGAEQAQDQGQK